MPTIRHKMPSINTINTGVKNTSDLSINGIYEQPKVVIAQ